MSDHLTDTALQIFCAIVAAGQSDDQVRANPEAYAQTAFLMAHAFHKVAADRERTEQQQTANRRYLSGPRGERS